MKDDRYYLELCSGLARVAQNLGNPACGCIIVLNDQIIATAGEASRSRGDVTCHAEIEAVRAAVSMLGNNLSGCTLYTTHEPCIMCAYPIRYYGVSKVVILLPVPFLGSVSSDYPLLTSTNTPPHWALPPEIVWHNDSAT